MKRRIFNLLAALSLVMWITISATWLAATQGVWFRIVFATERVLPQQTIIQRVQFDTYKSALLFQRGDEHRVAQSGQPPRFLGPRGYAVYFDSGSDPAEHFYAMLPGEETGVSYVATEPFKYRYVPYWMPTFALAALPACAVISHLARRRRGTAGEICCAV